MSWAGPGERGEAKYGGGGIGGFGGGREGFSAAREASIGGGSPISAAQMASPGREAFGKAPRQKGSLKENIGYVLNTLGPFAYLLDPVVGAGLQAFGAGLGHTKPDENQVSFQKPFPSADIFNDTNKDARQGGFQALTPELASAFIGELSSMPTGPSAIDSTQYNKDIMDQYFSTLWDAPSGGSRGIRGAGIPGHRQQQKRTADEWLNKYWRE